MEQLESKIKALLRYSFYDDDYPIEYEFLTIQEMAIISREDYEKLLKYIEYDIV